MKSSSGRATASLFLPTVLLGALAFVVTAPAQSHLPKVEFEPELRALIAIKARMVRTINAIPSYTCAQTIRRTQLNEKARQRLEKMIRRLGENEARGRVARDFSDTVSLEVAIIDGAEI